MVYSSVPVYLDPPSWQQQPGSSNENHQLPQPVPLPGHVGGGGGNMGTVKPGSMVERAKLSTLPMPEAALKCPRCESTNANFCNFNNYSLSQPRHFCKTCRRYWTRGGALRNVAVGRGCWRKGSSTSKSPVLSSLQTGPSSSSTPACSNSCTTDIIGHLPSSTSQLPFLPSFHYLSSFRTGDNGFYFGEIQSTAAVSAGGSGGTFDMEFQSGSNLCGTGPILSARFAEQWRLQQQAHQFPLLGSLETSAAIYKQFEGEGVQPSSYLGEATGSPGSKPLNSGLSQTATVKLEENQGLNISRKFMGVPGNNQCWEDNAWTDLSGFTLSSDSHLL